MRSFILLTALLLLACDGGVGPVDAAVPDTGPPDSGRSDTKGPGIGADGLAGTVRYEDRPYDSGGFTGELLPLPARGVMVELRGGEGTVAKTRTDDEGCFVFAETGLAPGAAVTIRVVAETAFGDHHAQVTMPRSPGQQYTFDTAAEVGDGALEVLARYDAGLGGAFNIMDAAYDAFSVYAPHVGAAAPVLSVSWERGYAFGCGSCFDDEDNVISLGGQFDDTDEYDDHIILHEIGHYFVEHYGRDTSPGGSHRDRLVSPELAYGEGLAYFFAAMVHGSPVVIDTYEGALRVIDIEGVTLDGVARSDFHGTSDGGPGGDLREEIVAGVLWDAFDPSRGEEAFDRVAVGQERMLELLVGVLHDPSTPNYGAPGVDLADYLHGLECALEVPGADVQALADDRGFPYAAGGGC